MNETAVFEKFTGLAALDYGILAAAVLALFAISWFKGREESDTRDYFLGSKNVPWWGIGLSIVAAETSALTIIGADPQRQLAFPPGSPNDCRMCAMPSRSVLPRHRDAPEQ